MSVSAVGGSNTAGAGGLEPGTGGPPFMPRLFDWVRQVSPGAAHTLKHAGIGASTSSLYSVCANDMVQPDADLVGAAWLAGGWRLVGGCWMAVALVALLAGWMPACARLQAGHASRSQLRLPSFSPSPSPCRHP